MKRQKLTMIRARVSIQMKRDLTRLVELRGESEAVLIREAIREYIENRIRPPETSNGPKNKH